MDQLERKRYERRLREHFTPERLRQSLISASLLLAAYEFLKTRIISNTRDRYIQYMGPDGVKAMSHFPLIGDGDR